MRRIGTVLSVIVWLARQFASTMPRKIRGRECRAPPSCPPALVRLKDAVSETLLRASPSNTDQSAIGTAEPWRPGPLDLPGVRHYHGMEHLDYLHRSQRNPSACPPRGNSTPNIPTPWSANWRLFARRSLTPRTGWPMLWGSPTVRTRSGCIRSRNHDTRRPCLPRPDRWPAHDGSTAGRSSSAVGSRAATEWTRRAPVRLPSTMRQTASTAALAAAGFAGRYPAPSAVWRSRATKPQHTSRASVAISSPRSFKKKDLPNSSCSSRGKPTRSADSIHLARP